MRYEHLSPVNYIPLQINSVFENKTHFLSVYNHGDQDLCPWALPSLFLMVDCLGFFPTFAIYLRFLAYCGFSGV